MLTISLDAMGGDFGTRTVVPAALIALNKHPHLRVILVGDSYIINKQLKRHQAIDHERIIIKHASEKIGMDEDPLHAMRSKRDSSMRVALNLVRDGEASACVSAGNTGALLALAKYVLKTLPGIDRPAIVRSLPTTQRSSKIVRMLDLGANVDSSPENLMQFAIMGSIMASALDGVHLPSVSLLNIGEEEIKGNELVKKTHQLLKQCPDINYAGFIEGDHIYSGKSNVIVCDGFTGNVALKVAEGTVKFVLNLLKDAFEHNFFTKMAALAAIKILKGVKRTIDPERHNGACLVGLNGIVIKSHGGARSVGFAFAIDEAISAVQKNIPNLIKEKITTSLQGNNT